MIKLVGLYVRVGADVLISDHLTIKLVVISLLEPSSVNHSTNNRSVASTFRSSYVSEYFNQAFLRMTKPPRCYILLHTIHNQNKSISAIKRIKEEKTI